MAEGMAFGFDIKFVITITAIVVVLLLRWGLVATIRKQSDYFTDRQRWWISLVKNISTASILAMLFLVWAPEIEKFALSITAVAVAVVIATKELLLCLSGAIWRGASRPFSVGDWIEVGGHSGEVIEESLFSTTLQEVDPRDYELTGRAIWLPNSLFLSQPVVNHNFRKRFIFHQFTLYWEPVIDAEAAAERIRAAVDAKAAEFADLAHRYAKVIEKSWGAHFRSPEPGVRIRVTELAKLAFEVSLFCPRDKAAAIEDAAVLAMLATTDHRAMGALIAPVEAATTGN
jgi:small-conductance mechanosensitive channel